MEGSIDLRETYGVLARKLEIILRAQAPSEKIASSIRVESDRDGMYIVMDRGYGTYLYRGTMDERSAGSIDTGDMITEELLDALSGYAPRENPGTGVGGIKPRYFLNFTDTVKEMIGDELSVAYAQAIEGMIQEQFEMNL